VDFLSSTDNDKINAIYLARFDANRMSQPSEGDIHKVRQWIIRKYRDRAFYTEPAAGNVVQQQRSTPQPTLVQIPPKPETDLFGGFSDPKAAQGQGQHANDLFNSHQQQSPMFQANFADFGKQQTPGAQDIFPADFGSTQARQQFAQQPQISSVQPQQQQSVHFQADFGSFPQVSVQQNPNAFPTSFGGAPQQPTSQQAQSFGGAPPSQQQPTQAQPQVNGFPNSFRGPQQPQQLAPQQQSQQNTFPTSFGGSPQPPQPAPTQQPQQHTFPTSFPGTQQPQQPTPSPLQPQPNTFPTSFGGTTSSQQPQWNGVPTSHGGLPQQSNLPGGQIQHAQLATQPNNFPTRFENPTHPTSVPSFTVQQDPFANYQQSVPSGTQQQFPPTQTPQAQLNPQIAAFNQHTHFQNPQGMTNFNATFNHQPIPSQPNLNPMSPQAQETQQQAAQNGSLVMGSALNSQSNVPVQNNEHGAQISPSPIRMVQQPGEVTTPHQMNGKIEDAFAHLSMQSHTKQASDTSGNTGTPSVHSDKKPDTSSSKYKAGQKVHYNSATYSGPAEIVKVHLDDDLQPFYTILVQGKEKQTDDAHLKEESPLLIEVTQLLSSLNEEQLGLLKKFIASQFLGSAGLAITPMRDVSTPIPTSPNAASTLSVSLPPPHSMSSLPNMSGGTQQQTRLELPSPHGQSTDFKPMFQANMTHFQAHGQQHPLPQTNQAIQSFASMGLERQLQGESPMNDLRPNMQQSAQTSMSTNQVHAFQSGQMSGSAPVENEPITESHHEGQKNQVVHSVSQVSAPMENTHHQSHSAPPSMNYQHQAQPFNQPGNAPLSPKGNPFDMF
jgi:hypothetical protein